MVRDKVKDGPIVVKHIDSEVMIADTLTKGPAFEVCNEHVTKIGVVNSFDIL